MNTNINLSQLKDKLNGNVIITALLIILAIVLGYTCWYTFDEGEQLQAAVTSQLANYNENRTLLKNLKELKANSNYYLAQREKYDEVIAESGSYNPVDYYVELSELCDQYDLKIQEITVGEMVADGNVFSASSTLTVLGEEINVKRMIQHVVSEKEVARVDSIAMIQQEDGTVVASIAIVNFTK